MHTVPCNNVIIFLNSIDQLVSVSTVTVQHHRFLYLVCILFDSPGKDTTMSWSRLLTVQTRAFVANAQSRTRCLSTSVLLFKEEPTSTTNPVFWLAAMLAAASGAGSIAVATTFCEEQAPDEARPQRFFSKKDGLRDPMTTYAIYAMEREMKLEEMEKMKAQPEVTDSTTAAPTTVQATSVADPSVTNGDPASNSTPPVSETAPVDMSAATRGEPVMTLSEARIEEATRKAKQHSGGLKIFSGNGNMSLALEIARHLGVNLGKATVGKFADGEVNVVIHENVRGKDVYVVQPTGPPVNDNIMELLLMVSTLRRSSARRITVVIPYYGYARQDRKMQV